MGKEEIQIVVVELRDGFMSHKSYDSRLGMVLGYTAWSSVKGAWGSPEHIDALTELRGIIDGTLTNLKRGSTT